MNCRTDRCNNPIHTLIVSFKPEYRCGFCKECWDMNKHIFQLYKEKGYINNIVHLGHKVKVITEYYDDLEYGAISKGEVAIIREFNENGLGIAKDTKDRPVYVPYSSVYDRITGVVI